MSRLCVGVRSVHPIAAAPMQFGIAKITHAHTPYSRTSSTGRNMPMTQVQEAARKVARIRSLRRLADLRFAICDLRLEEKSGGASVNCISLAFQSQIANCKLQIPITFACRA